VSLPLQDGKLQMSRRGLLSGWKETTDMSWTKPEFKEVAVTLEVTAYSARR
jgi:coenzyme PQQ precursor peptide PqqA